MKLLDTILLYLASALLIIGIYETFLYGLQASYWLFMLMVILLFIYGYRKRPQPPAGPTKNQINKNLSSLSKKKK